MSSASSPNYVKNKFQFFLSIEIESSNVLLFLVSIYLGIDALISFTLLICSLICLTEFSHFLYAPGNDFTEVKDQSCKEYINLQANRF